MRLLYTERFLAALKDAPPPIQKAFAKQARLLAINIRHPSLHAKKYDEAQDVWQARVNRDWRFYFQIVGERYYVVGITPHPK